MPNEKQVVLRLPADLVERVNKLVGRVTDDPKLAGLGRVTRSSVFRLALTRGLDALERETGGLHTKRAARSPRR